MPGRVVSRRTMLSLIAATSSWLVGAAIAVPVRPKIVSPLTTATLSVPSVQLPLVSPVQSVQVPPTSPVVLKSATVASQGGPLVTRSDALSAPAGSSRGASYSAVALDHPGVLQFVRDDPTSFALPPFRARIRLIGDMHFGFTSEQRLNALTRDLATLPRPDALMTTGDEVHTGTQVEYDKAKSWIDAFDLPFHTVTGNHTFWNASVRHQESTATLLERWSRNFPQPTPNEWEIAGVRFIGLGPMSSGPTPTDASLAPHQIDELRSWLTTAPDQPTVLVMHSPLHHTVLQDSTNNCYTSDQLGFFQQQSDALQAVIESSPQVALVITGHTHSPLRAQGLLALVDTGDRVVPHFNAMAVPFLRRMTSTGAVGSQPLITWEIGIGDKHLWLLGRDHLSQQDVATAVVPLQPTSRRESQRVEA